MSHGRLSSSTSRVRAAPEATIADSIAHSPCENSSFSHSAYRRDQAPCLGMAPILACSNRNVNSATSRMSARHPNPEQGLLARTALNFYLHSTLATQETKARANDTDQHRSQKC